MNTIEFASQKFVRPFAARSIITLLFLACALLTASFNANAERPYKVFESLSLNIKLANDGTGIIKDVACHDCDFRVINITANSKATVSGVEVDIMEARSRAGKSAMVSYNPKTREVLYIRWPKSHDN